MRGIAGIIRFDRQPVTTAQIERLLQQMASGTFDRATHACAGPVGFGHLLRFASPEDRFEAQPLRSADGNLFLVTDALLDNRTELAASFGWSFGNANRQPDSAFVLAAYEKWGEACPARLDGRWAFAVWHLRERRLFAAVDHFSFRPFYYVRQRTFLAFATTLRGLLSLPDVSREIHDGILADFLLLTRSHPGDTLYRQIKSLPAAHLLWADETKINLARYWRADPGRELKLGSDSDYLAAFCTQLEEAVNAGLRVEGNIGIMLSGGLDSSAIAAVAGKLLAAQGRRLQAIHRLPPEGGPRFAPGRQLDESSHVRRIQAHLPHVDFHFLPPPTGENRVSLAEWNTLFDEHCVPLRGIPLARTSPADGPFRRLQLNRIFTGHGGNYAVSLEEYSSDYFLQLATRLHWWRLAQELRGHARFYHRTVRHLVKYRLLLPLLPAREAIHDTRPALLDYLNSDFVRDAAMAERLRQPRFRRWQRADFNVKLRLASVLDHLMPQSVGACGSVMAGDGRCDTYAPLMTRRLNEFCLSVPVAQQLYDGRDRLLLRRAMQGLLPDNVIWRISRGFDAPDSWLAARQLITALPGALNELDQSPLVARYINLPELHRLFNRAGDEGIRRLGPTRFIDLCGVAWFLRWLETQVSQS